MRRARTSSAATLLLTVGAVLSSAAPASAEDCPQGAIAVRYDQLGGATSKLGAPTSCELPTADGAGRFTTFDRGSIYWSQASGAWDVSGSFEALWASFGWENGFLHYPTSGEVGIKDDGVFQNYQGGTLYWAPDIAPHSVSGSFFQLYASSGYENGFLGYPASQEAPIRAGGVYQVYQGGVMYWSPQSGPHTVSGSFRQLYGALGFENGFLAYPTSQEAPARNGGVFQVYQGGVMYWSPTTGPQAVGGAILDAYAEVGHENGPLGYPTSNEFDIPGGKRSNFQGGFIEWSAATGPLVNRTISTPVQPPVVVTPAPPVQPAPPTEVYYANCAAVRAAGAAPLYRGQPGYRSGLDRDGDGVACE